MSPGTALTFTSAAQSDVGRRRVGNEDSFIAAPELGLWAVADGMGGHAAGEVASRIAVEELRRSVASAPDGPYLADPSLPNRRTLLDWLARVVGAINAVIFERARDDAALRGMGCTLDVALVRGGGLFLAHVGDSRVYSLRGGRLLPLTEDHTLGQMLLASGAVPPDEVAAHPQRNVLMRALGPYPAVQVDTAYVELAPGDRYLLCSDGLYNEVEAPRLAALLDGEPAAAAGALIAAALDAGGRDNVTAVIVGVADRGAEATVAPPVIGDADAGAVLGRCALFSAFTPSELLRVQRLASARLVATGGELYRENAPVTSLYVLLEGHVTMLREGQRVGDVGPGDPFGDLTLHGTVSPATTRADVDCRVLEFPLVELRHLLDTDLAIAAKLQSAALARVGRRLSTMVDVVARYRRIFGDLTPEL